MKMLPNALFIGIGVLMLWQIHTAPEGRALQPGDPGPWILPAILGGLMVLMGTAELVREFRKRRSAVTASAAIDPQMNLKENAGVTRLAPPSMTIRIVFGVALVSYVALFQTLGFTLATVGFIFTTVMALSDMNGGNFVRAAVTAVVTSLVIGWVLAGVVGVPIPGVLLLP